MHVKYDQKSELPSGVANNLPDHAQDIYLSAYNSAFEDHEDEDDAKQIAHRIAWSAVKQSYEKSSSGNWHRKS